MIFKNTEKKAANLLKYWSANALAANERAEKKEGPIKQQAAIILKNWALDAKLNGCQEQSEMYEHLAGLFSKKLPFSQHDAEKLSMAVVLSENELELMRQLYNVSDPSHLSVYTFYFKEVDIVRTTFQFRDLLSADS